MRFKRKGYRYKGFELGQKVMHDEKECVIIGFDETSSRDFIALYTGSPIGMHRISESKYATSILERYENETDWEWVVPSRIQPIQPLKDDVLSIKTTQINNKYSAVEITYQDENVLNRNEFYDKKIGVTCGSYPDYSYKTNTLYIKGRNDSKDDVPFIVENKYLKDIEEKVRLINEKYGIPKRWRAERNCAYYFISDSMNILCSEEIYNSICDVRYTKGNYFKTEEDAMEKLEKIKNILVGENNE